MSTSVPPKNPNQAAVSSVPVAVPFVSSTHPMNHLESGPSGSSTTGNSPRGTSTWKPGAATPERITGRRGLQAVRDSLSDRDWAVLRSVSEHRFLTTRHIQDLHFTPYATPLSAARLSRRVVRRLAGLRILRHLERRIGGARAGSASYVWTLGPLGVRLLNTGPAATTYREREPSERLVKHTLAIAEAHLALLTAHRAGQLELLGVQLEPASWRRYTGLGGEPHVLRPDLSAVTGAGEFEDHWFMEIDLGNEHLPTIRRKCQQYQAYRDSGIEQQANGVFPLVVWAMHNQVRADALTDVLHTTRRLDPGLFRITTADRLVELIQGGAA